MTAKSHSVPRALLQPLERIPADRGVALLLRHSVRDGIPDGDTGIDLPITAVGRRLAIELGRRLQGRICTLKTSPVRRCVETAEALAVGAVDIAGIETDSLLGDPGVFVLDAEMAWSNWLELGHSEVMRHLSVGSEALSGMARPAEAARYLLNNMLAHTCDRPGLHLFVTHDSILSLTTAQVLGKELSGDEWPGYLDGAFFWSGNEGVHVAYQIYEALCTALPTGVSEFDVVELARREVSNTIGLDSDIHFYLAGGAYKSLLTGKLPRELDVWAATEQDRAALIQTLKSRGAQPGPEATYSDSFQLAGRVIDVPHKTAPGSLCNLLSEFDIGLSAIGVEHHANGEWTPRIEPLAHESIKRKEVRLLKPLVNWKYALTTLERLRRYAKELDFSVPEDEEKYIWSVFEGQTREMRQGMVDRFHRTARKGYGVEGEIACRFR